MNALVRLIRALPLVIALAVLAVVVYVVVAGMRSPNRAKEILIKLFTVVTTVLSVAFLLFAGYALLDGNEAVFDLAWVFAVVSIVALAITRLCRRRFAKHHPQYRFKTFGVRDLRRALEEFLARALGGFGRR